MPTLDWIREALRGLEGASPFAFVLAALAGLLMALTPTVLATVPAVMGYVAGEPGLKCWKAFTRSLAFVLGTATTFAVYGLIFGWAGRRLAPLFGPNGYLIAGVALILLGLAMLGKLRMRVPALSAVGRQVESLGGAYALGLPFGLVGSTCPCSIPVVLALLLYASSVGSAWFGAALLFVFAVVRGLPLLLAGTFTGLLKDVNAIARWQPRLEKISAAVLLVLGAGFVGQRFGTVDPTVAAGITVEAVVAAGIAGILLLVWLVATVFLGRAAKDTGPKDEGVPLTEAEFRTPGMVCEGCAATLTTALLALQAVHKVVPDVKEKRVRVFYNAERMTEDRLRERVEEMGFL